MEDLLFLCVNVYCVEKKLRYVLSVVVGVAGGSGWLGSLAEMLYR